MIENLTPERLRELGFNDETIKRLETWEDYNVNLIGDEIFHASGNEKKIYSGIHAGRKIYFRDEERPTFPEGCLDIYPDYYKLTLAKYLKESKAIAQSLYQEASEIKAFHLDQVKAMKKVIKDTKALKSEADLLLITNSLSNKIARYVKCLMWLNNMPVEGIAPSSETSPVKGEYFEGIKKKLFDASEPWEYYFETINDANAFVQCLNDYFEKGIIPNAIKIRNKPGSMTKMGKALTPVWNYYTKTNKKNKDEGFFKTVRVLTGFIKKTDQSISKMM